MRQLFHKVCLFKKLITHSNVKFTQFCRRKGCSSAWWPPPPIIFERLKLPQLQEYIYRRKGNLSESPNHFKYWENVLISRCYEQFSRSSQILGHTWRYKKISNSQNRNITHIVLKRLIWTFQIHNLFCEKFKFRRFTKALKNVAKYIIPFIFEKFKYFKKQIIYLESPDHPLQNDI